MNLILLALHDIPSSQIEHIARLSGATRTEQIAPHAWRLRDAKPHDGIADYCFEHRIDYGFVPQTLWDDGDALDVILLTTYPLVPGILVRARPVAIMHMIDSGDCDDKVIAVPSDDPRWKDVADIADINKHTLKEIEHFYATYKQLQNKEVTISGFDGKAEAEAAFEKGRKLYNESK